MEWPYKYFKPHEVLSPDGLAQLQRNKWIKCQKEALDTFTDWREWIDVGISVNSGELKRRGYRSPKENRMVSGGTESAHIQGIAFDQTPHNYPVFDYFVKAIYWSYLRYKAGKVGFRGLGIYPQSNFMHGDTRHALGGHLMLWNGYPKKVLTLSTDFDELPIIKLDTWLIKNLNLPTQFRLETYNINELIQGTL